MTPSFQIIVPVYNEAATLEIVLAHARDAGYLHYMVFVDDASTDDSPRILQQWTTTENLRAIRLDVNRRKEGAIRAAMELLEQEGELAPYTVLLDSDSLIGASDTGESVHDRLLAAIAHMQERGFSGMAFRIEAIAHRRANLFSFSAFADYSAMQFDQWLVGHQRQLWVINGPGGLFETRPLLRILRTMVPDFETGDLLITVELMKERRAIAFYPHVAVLTFIPTTLRAYFNQRRRWERGTAKVIWRERAFYAGLFRRPSLLALWTLVHFSPYAMLIAAVVMLGSQKTDPQELAFTLLASFGVWFCISLVKGLWIKATRPAFPYLRYCGCALANGLLWVLATTAARYTGFGEAIYQLARPARRRAALPAALHAAPRRLPRLQPTSPPR